MTQNKLFGNAIRQALLADGGKRLKMIAEIIVKKAIGGDTDAIKEINSRLKQAKTQK